CALLPLQGCVCGDGVNAGDVNLISLEEEWAMGEQLSREIQQQVPIVEDPLIEPYVQAMGERIVGVTERDDQSWTFHLVADTSITAFNLPGGHVFVHTGSITAAESPDEVAGVLAHEIAHGVARHATEQ